MNTKNRTALIGVAIAMAACGGTKVLDNPQPLVLERPVTSASDQQLEAHLDWVIVRDGPGTWVKGADWDEYLLRVRNLSDEPIRITGAAVYDSLGTRLETSANLDKLISASRKTAGRYRSESIKVKAGIGVGTLMAAGDVALIGGEVLGLAVLAGSASASAAGVALGAVVLAPVLIVSGIVQRKNKERVARVMASRHSPRPVDLAANELQSLTFFFPLAPSPTHIELVYANSDGEHKLIIDTREELHGLHIDNKN